MMITQGIPHVGQALLRGRRYLAATAAVRIWLMAVRTNWSRISSQLPVPV